MADASNGSRLLWVVINMVLPSNVWRDCRCTLQVAMEKNFQSPSSWQPSSSYAYSPIDLSYSYSASTLLLAGTWKVLFGTKLHWSPLEWILSIVAGCWLLAELKATKAHSKPNQKKEKKKNRNRAGPSGARTKRSLEYHERHVNASARC